MRTCVAQCCLAQLGLALLLCSSGALAQPDLEPDLQPDEGLRQRRLLQRARAPGISAQDWNKREMEDLLSQFTLPEAEIQESDISALEKEDLRVELERSADNPKHNQFPSRERKTSCVFYWKVFNTC
ncbi:somatostatin 1.2 [Brachyhypopomus gauderio]|uniref:somatostatin 1.2 n=1 Tax=Brachyhypopomus gauderio TaxID=698409 RepID=UPI004041BBC2